MDFEKLAQKAKQVVDERGGVEALKEDAMELKNIAAGDESLTEKAKEAAAALKDPGAPGEPGQKGQSAQQGQPGQTQQ